jgi:spermidine synthase
MKPWELLGQVETPEGSLLALTKRDTEYVILADGRSLMSSRMKGSEEALATIGCERASKLERPRVLVGGLGMGFTLRATLDALPAEAEVVVAELMPVVVEWNRGPLGHLAHHPLADARVQVALGDVGQLLRRAAKADDKARFDAILLDVDNGPSAFTQDANAGLYGNEGVGTARAALRANGVYAVWSAREDRKFEHRLRHHGFDAESCSVRARLKQGGPRHTIFVGRL